MGSRNGIKIKDHNSFNKNRNKTTLLVHYTSNDVSYLLF